MTPAIDALVGNWLRKSESAQAAIQNAQAQADSSLRFRWSRSGWLMPALGAFQKSSKIKPPCQTPWMKSCVWRCRSNKCRS